MRRPVAEELLRAWETGANRSWAARAVLLAALTESNGDAGAIVRLSIGDRDARIFRLRELLFGPHLDCLTECPSCGESLETTLSIDSIMGNFAAVTATHAVERLTVEDHEIVFRLPNSEDLLALDDDPSYRTGTKLLHGCILNATTHGQPVAPVMLPDAVLRAITERMEEADPRADMRLDLDCPQCGHRWQAGFDIVSHVWLEVEAWARRIIGDVHVLASAYGWHERDILAMTEARRRAYLDFVEV